MKYILYHFFIFSTLLFITNCSKSRGKLDDIQAPAWVFDPYSITSDQEEIAAVGIADDLTPDKIMPDKLKIQIARCKTDATASIAAELGSQVHRSETDSNSQINSADTGAKEDKKDKLSHINQKVDAAYEQLTQIFTSQSVSAVRTTHMYQSQDGTLFCRLAIKIDRMKKIMNDEVFAISKKLDNKSKDIFLKEVENRTKSLFAENKHKASKDT